MRNETLCGTGDFLNACFRDSFSQLVELLKLYFSQLKNLLSTILLLGMIVADILPYPSI